MGYIIRWVNKYSQEEGYVGSTSTKNRCFYNSDRQGAKQYASRRAAERALAMLVNFGEAENNNFEIEEVYNIPTATGDEIPFLC